MLNSLIIFFNINHFSHLIEDNNSGEFKFFILDIVLLYLAFQPCLHLSLDKCRLI